MAITKLLRIKETKGTNKAAHLKHNIFYICNPDKTGNGFWIGGNAGSGPEIIYQNMITNKKMWSKEKGTQAFHYVISFPPTLDINEATAYRFAEDFCNELLNDKYLYCFAVHNDQQHLHVHVTFDAVSKTDGRKFHSPKGDWEKRIQPITDRLCRKYHIPSLEYDKQNTAGTGYDTWKFDQSRKSKSNNENEKTGEGKNKRSERVTWNDIIRDDIDEAIGRSRSYDEFIRVLKEEMHYKVNDGKVLSLCPFGKEKSVRCRRLGSDYDQDRIKERIRSERKGVKFKTYGGAFVHQTVFEKTKEGTWNISSYQAAFYANWHFTANIRHPMYSENWRYKKDVLNVIEYGKQTSYIIHHDLRTEKDLKYRIKKLQDEKKDLEKAGRILKKKLLPGGEYLVIKKILRLMEQKKEFPIGSRPDIDAEIEHYKSIATENMSLQETIEEYKKTEKQVEQYERKLRSIEDELDLCDRIAKMKFHEYKYKNDWLYPESEKTRITVNKKLFSTLSDLDYFCCKLPGQKEYLKIPNEDTYTFNERTVSAYLYDRAQYDIVDQNGNYIRKVKGTAVKASFDNRTRKSVVK